MTILKNQQAGFSLVEVLVALLILSFGLLGLAGLQITGLQQNQGALHRTRATQLATSLIDCMRAGSAASYVLALADAPPAPLFPAATMPERNLIGWMADIAATLPGGDASVDVNGGLVTVTIEWTGDRQGTTYELEVVSQL